MNLTRSRYTPKKPKDGRNWRDLLLPEERQRVAMYEDLLRNGIHKLPSSAFPELKTLRNRATKRLEYERQGKPFKGKTKAARVKAAATKLNWQKVREIRMSGDAYVDLAARYGVSEKMIREVRAGRRWVERPGAKYPRSGMLRARRALRTRAAQGPIRDERGWFISSQPKEPAP